MAGLYARFVAMNTQTETTVSLALYLNTTPLAIYS